MQFLDAVTHRHRLRHTRLPDRWQRVEVRCPACGRLFIGLASPREDSAEGSRAARLRLLRSCPEHHPTFVM
jgi:hypothetical protein